MSRNLSHPVLLTVLLAVACKGDRASEDAAVGPVRVAEHESEPTESSDASGLPSGPRAPVTDVFGFAVGKSTRADVQARLESLGVKCVDTGPRALMQAMREDKKAQLEEATKTSDADAVSGASMLYKKSKHEKNPQVRLSCEDVRLRQFGVERSADIPGRTLIVFDGPEAPLRHVSSRRNHADITSALADVDETVAAWTAIYGAPTGTRGDAQGLALPEPTATSARWEWSFGDFQVKISLLSIGGKRFSVSERAEVPMKVRADAPTLARGPQEAAPAEPQ